MIFFYSFALAVYYGVQLLNWLNALMLELYINATCNYSTAIYCKVKETIIAPSIHTSSNVILNMYVFLLFQDSWCIWNWVGEMLVLGRLTKFFETLLALVFLQHPQFYGLILSRTKILISTKLLSETLWYSIVFLIPTEILLLFWISTWHTCQHSIQDYEV